MYPWKLTPLYYGQSQSYILKPNHAQHFPTAFSPLGEKKKKEKKSAESATLALWPMTHAVANPGCGLEGLGKTNKTSVRIRSLVFDLHPGSASGRPDRETESTPNWLTTERE